MGLKDMNKENRLIFIAQILRGRDEEDSLTIAEIHQRLCDQGIDLELRSVRRYMEEISDRYGVVSTEDRPARFFISTDFQIKHNLDLSEAHIQALLIALNNLKYTSDKYFERYAEDVESIILKSLPPSSVEILAKEKKSYNFDFTSSGRPMSGNPKDVEKIMLAIRWRRLFECKNNSPYKDQDYNNKVRRFYPLGLRLTSGVPYLKVIEKDDPKKVIKSLRLSRLSEVELHEDYLDESIQIKWSDFNSDHDGYGGPAQKILIECDLELARYLEENIQHTSQHISKIDDENYRIEFNMALSTKFERLLISFAGHLHKIEPQSLQQKVEAKWIEGIQGIEKKLKKSA